MVSATVDFVLTDLQSSTDKTSKNVAGQCWK